MRVHTTSTAWTKALFSSLVAVATSACALVDGYGDRVYDMNFVVETQSVNVPCQQLYCTQTSPASGSFTGRLDLNGVPRLTVREGCSGDGSWSGDSLFFSFTGQSLEACYSFTMRGLVSGKTVTGRFGDATNPHGAGKSGRVSGIAIP